MVSADDQGWILEWAQGGSVLEGFGLPPQLAEQMQPFLEDAELPPIRYRLFDDGVLGDVENVDDLRSALLNTMQAISKASGGSDPTVTQLIGVYEGMSDSDLALLMTEPMQIYHFFDGVAVDVSAGEVDETALPNVFGGDPIPAIARLEVETLADEGDCVVLRHVTEIDSERAAPIIAESLATTFGASSDRSAEFETFMSQLRIENTIRVRIDGATGRVVESVGSQVASSGDEEQTETTTIRDLSA